MSAPEAEMVIAAARRHDVFLMEAFMYRTHPQTRRLVEMQAAGAIGRLRLIQASFGYWKPFDAAGRYFNPVLGGGGILDVGGYCTSMARLLAGVAAGQPYLDPEAVQAAALLGRSGVDEVAVATLRFPGKVLAQLSVSVALPQENKLRIFGTEGWIEVDPLVLRRETGWPSQPDPARHRRPRQRHHRRDARLALRHRGRCGGSRHPQSPGRLARHALGRQPRQHAHPGCLAGGDRRLNIDASFRHRLR
ncbi:Gfo/Idh/MocA family protein [Siccirubricoccus deserti]